MVDFILLYVLMGLINLAGITTSIMIRSIIQIGSTGNILSARVSIGTVFYYRGIWPMRVFIIKSVRQIVRMV